MFKVEKTIIEQFTQLWVIEYYQFNSDLIKTEHTSYDDFVKHIKQLKTIKYVYIEKTYQKIWINVNEIN